MSLHGRVVLSMGGVAVVGALLMALLVTGPLVSITLLRSAKLFQVIPDAELRRCAQDPAAWHYRGPRGVEAFALDPDQMIPLNAGSPPLPWLMRLRLRWEPELAVLGRQNGAALLLRPEGRCSPIVVFWPLQAGMRRSVGVWILLISLLALGGGLGAAFLLVIRPLVRSVERLDVAGRSVGLESYAHPVVDPALRSAVHALDDAHVRVLEDRQALVKRTDILERHLADVAHDLRTPLASLQLRLERLERGDQLAMRGALQDVATLGLLTENLGLKSQLQHGLSTGGQCEIVAVVQRVAERFVALGSRVGIEVVHAVVDGPVWVDVPAVHAEQLLSNLVHNAVRHNQSGGHVAIVLEEGDGHFVLEVSDDGPGTVASLPVERGAGLGLSIVRQLARHYGWTLRFDDAEPGIRVRLQGEIKKAYARADQPPSCSKITN